MAMHICACVRMYTNTYNPVHEMGICINYSHTYVATYIPM